MSEQHETWFEGLKPAPQRTFGNPFAAWHYRTLDKSMYFTDVDGMEVVGTYPVIKYENKTINPTLFKAIMQGEDLRNAQVVADFFGRFDLWQAQTFNNDLRAGLQEGYFVVNPSNVERFFTVKFEWVLKALNRDGEIRKVLDARRGTEAIDPFDGPRRINRSVAMLLRPAADLSFGPALIRNGFVSPQTMATWIDGRRRKLADQWKWAEKNELL